MVVNTATQVEFTDCTSYIQASKLCSGESRCHSTLTAVVFFACTLHLINVMQYARDIVHTNSCSRYIDADRTILGRCGHLAGAWFVL